MFTVASLFTKDDGDPATGLTLAEIDVYLYRRAKDTGVVSTVWNGVNPTEEIGGGLYGRAYTTDDFATYEYFAYAHYTGATVLDTEYALQSVPTVTNALTTGTGAITFTYTLTSTVDASPIVGADVWATTDAAGANVVASGVTNVSGVVVFYLDAGTYYIWRQLAGWDFTNPDQEVVA